MKDKLLFTPGPLTTSMTVKQAMLRDLGSRDFEFINLVKEIRDQLLELGNVSQAKGYECVIMQGSGTFGVESMISSALAKDGHLLVLVNGAYGERICKMAEVHGFRYDALTYDEDQAPSVQELDDFLAKNPSVSHVVVVHCETTTGIFNPIKEYGMVIRKHGKRYMVDAMSSFGAVPVDLAECNIDFLVSSSNKCIEGVPGFSFTLVSQAALKECEGRSRTLSLDLFAQWKGLENNGQFRFTPPTHSLLAYHQAIKELYAEGGVEGRSARYQKNYQTLVGGMRNMGFTEYLPEEKQGYIITTFNHPDSANFNFNAFYEKLNERGFAIYPGKLTKADCFRIGNIGRISTEDVEALLSAIAEVKAEMGF
ncbi:MAG: 2-aminoethylphosphonate--pyruvate transaminase [Flavobacteriales bacterium]|nr:2-aminoethylphosphonate--pyruvate transaminase [Flavobacteriales bacterium]